MEASSVCNCNTIVPEALDDSNYKTWRKCMEAYLWGRDLWDVIIEDEPEAESAEENIIKSWKKKNSLAFHAILMSCSPDVLSKVVEHDSAKTAWDLLAAEGQSSDSDNDEEHDFDDDSFYKVVDGDWKNIEEFIECHPQAVSAKVFSERGTLLHYFLRNGQDKKAALLVNRMPVDDMEIVNKEGYTTLALGANKMCPGRLQTLELMVSKRPNLPNIGTPERLPVTIAAWNGFKKMARFLYEVTEKNIFNPESGTHGASLLVNCIESKLFDVASKLVQEFPDILWQCNDLDEYPVRVLATTFCALFPSENGHQKSSFLKVWRSNFREWIVKYLHHLLGKHNNTTNASSDEEFIRAQARDFLRLVCTHVSTSSLDTLVSAVYGAMIEATIHGNIEFINEMLSANPELIWAHNECGGMIAHAVLNRRAKIFNLIYPSIDNKDTLLISDNPEKNSILHLAAAAAPSHILDRTSGPALQVQTELQWFKEVWNVVNPRYREKLNNDDLTPHQLFTKTHEKLIDAGEKAMKDTAASSTVVGALIVTIMFAAAFTVPGGNNQDTGFPIFANEVLFKIFIVCDALSLYSSATSVLIFLGILTSRYAEDDFLLLLPRKLLLGISTLFFSITTMMVTFCAALAIMLNGRLQYIFPIVLLAFVPVILFLSSIFPLLSKIYKSTFGPSIFDKNTTLPSKKEYKKIMNNSSSATDFPNKKEGENITNNSSGVAEEFPTNKKEDEEIVNASSGDQLV